jgi:hypothetical protein
VLDRAGPQGGDRTGLVRNDLEGDAVQVGQARLVVVSTSSLPGAQRSSLNGPVPTGLRDRSPYCSTASRGTISPPVNCASILKTPGNGLPKLSLTVALSVASTAWSAA